MESLHQTDCSDLRNRTHPIALRVYFTKVAWLFILEKKILFQFLAHTFIIRLCHSNGFMYRNKQSKVGELHISGPCFNICTLNQTSM